NSFFRTAAGFLMPGSSLCDAQATGADRLFFILLVRRVRVQGTQYPGAELEAAEASNVSLLANFCLSVYGFNLASV
ncbi:MAG: hypothetical protein IJ664_07345, partial [Clostridia bacterium]|nr:hypothetical protein [Clostridia bacterium]